MKLKKMTAFLLTVTIGFTSVLSGIIVKADAEEKSVNILKQKKNESVGNAVEGFWQYEYDARNNTASITGYTGGESNVVIPSQLGDYTVTSIANGSGWYGTHGWESEARIESTVFGGNSYIEYVEIPDTVKEIGSYAFASCKNLIEISGMKNITKIGIGAFANCSKLEKIVNLNNVRDIGSAAFLSCTNLKHITIGAKEIKEMTFANCTSITNISLNTNTETIGRCAFYNCCSLIEVVGDWHIKKLDEEAFFACSSLQEFDLSSYEDTVIPNQCFCDCYALKSVDIPACVRTVKSGAFRECKSLKKINMQFGLLEIESHAFYNTTFDLVEIPNSVYKIGDNAFEYYVNYEDSNGVVVVPYSVEMIGGYAFLHRKIRTYKDSYAAKRPGGAYKVEEMMPIPCTSIEASEYYINLKVNELYQIKYTMQPTNTSDAIIWKSSAPEIASVNSLGEVIAESSGRASIIGTTTTGKKVTITVAVMTEAEYELLAPKIISDIPTELYMQEGQMQKLKAMVKDGLHPDKVYQLEYSSSNPSVAIVSSDGNVTAIGEGIATISVNTEKLSASYEIRVYGKNTVQTVAFEKGNDKQKLFLGDTYVNTLYGQNYLQERLDVSALYKSTDTSVAVVDGNGMVKAIGKGKCKIKATIVNVFGNKISAQYIVVVEERTHKVKFKISGKKMRIITTPNANVTVQGNKKIFGKSSIKKNTNASGVVTFTIKKKKGKKKNTITVKIQKTGYKTSNMSYTF